MGKHVAEAGIWLAVAGWSVILALCCAPNAPGSLKSGGEVRVSEYNGQTIQQMIEKVGGRYEDMRLIDEPPGMLYAVEWKGRREGRDTQFFVRVWGETRMFSEKFRWPKELVPSAFIRDAYVTN